MTRGLLDSANCALLVIDVQEAFRTVIGNFSPMVAKVCTAVEGAKLLEMPIVVTEQYPQGLGSTIEEISLVLPDNLPRLEKTTFGILGDDGIKAAIDGLGKRQLVVCGLETHVCVSQSCHQLRDSGYEVFLLEDAVASRFESDKTTALNRLRTAGIVLTSVEAMLFEGMRHSKHPNFEKIQSLVK
jgi:nicotinamidase-related amidase